MAGTQIPSVDWPRRSVALTGNEDLLKQNPSGDASPQEERIPVSLLADYIIGTINTLTSFTITLVDNLDGTYDIDNGIDSITIDTHADSNPITDAGGYFTGTNVEAALQELGASLALISDNTSVVTNNADGTYTHDDGAGNTVLIDTRANSNPIIDAGGYYVGTTVEAALQEIGADLAAISDNTSIVTDNADGTYTHDDGAGNTVLIDTRANSNPIIDAGGYYVGTTVEAALQEIGADLAAISDNTSIVTDNADGTYTHDDGAGNTVLIDTRANSNPIIDAGGYYTGTTVEAALQEIGLSLTVFSGNTSIVTDNADGTYTHDDGTGNTVLIDTRANSNPIIDAGGYYTGTTVEAALQEIGLSLTVFSGNTSIVTDNADGTYTHDDGTGNTVLIDTRANSNPIIDAGGYYTGTTVEAALQEIGADLAAISDNTSIVTDNADGTYTHDDGTGNTVLIDTRANSNPIIDAGGYYTGTTVEAALQEIGADLAAISDNTSIVTDNADGTYTHDDGTGNTVLIDTRANSNPIIDAGGYYTGTTVEAALQEIGASLITLSGNTSIVTDNADGTYTHDDGTGNTVLIDTRANSNPIIDAGGYYTGTTVEAALQEIGADLAAISDNTSIVTDNADGTYTHDDGAGNTVLIDTRADSNPIIDAGGYYTGTTVEAALQEIGSLLNLTTGNTHSDGTILWVTKSGGNNLTAERGNMEKPFADPWAARDNANEGDTICVLNGQWTFGNVASGADVEGTMDYLNLFTGFTTGIHYYFFPNTSLTHVNSGQTITGTSSVALFDDVIGLNCSVRGYLTVSFAESTPTNSIVHIDHATATHVFEFEEITYTNFGFSNFKSSNITVNINKIRPSAGSLSFFSFRERAVVSGLYVSCNVKDYYGSESDTQGLISSRSGGADVILENSNIYFNFNNIYKTEAVGGTSYVGKIFGLQTDGQLNNTNFTVDCKNLQYYKTTGTIATGTTDFQQAAIQVGGIQLSGSTVTYNINNCISDFCCIRVIGCTASESGFGSSYINLNGNFISNQSLVIHLDSLANPSGNGANKNIRFNGTFVSKDRQVLGDTRATKEAANITITGNMKTEAISTSVLDLTEPINLRAAVLENDGSTAPVTTSNGSDLNVICMGVYANSLTEGTNIVELASPIIRDTAVKI